MTQSQSPLKTSAKKEKDRRPSSVSKIAPLPEEQAVVTYVTLPPDGGWGWLVVAASFYVSFVSDGIINTAGLFIGRLDVDLGFSMTEVSLMGSLLSGMCLLVGPFVSAINNRYGFRVSAAIGASMAGIGFIVSSTCSNLSMIWLTYGIIAGSGFGFIYVPSVISIGFYFERWRSLATSIAACGAGFGTVLLAPIMSFLLDTFGWRTTMQVQAGLMFMCAIVGMAYRPLKPVQVIVPCEEDDESDHNEDINKNELSITHSHLLSLTKRSSEELRKGVSHTSVATEVSLTSPLPTHVNKFLKTGHNDNYATVHDILSNSHQNISTIFSQSVSCVHKTDEPKEPKFKVTVVSGSKETVKKDSSCLSINSNSNHSNTEGSQTHIDDLITKQYLSVHANSNRRRTSVMKLIDAGAISEQNHFRRLSACVKPRPSLCPSEGLRKRLSVCQATMTSGVRPLYKEDIFYQANLKRLPQYTSQSSGLEYAMATTRLPTLNDVLEEETSHCTLCPEAVRRTLTTMLDLSLLTSPSFFLLCFSGFLTNMGFYIPYMYLESRIIDGGLDPSLGKWMISTLGVSNTVGRALCGVISSLPNISAMMVNNVLLTAAGLATMMSGLYMTPTYQFTFAAIFGFCVSAFSALRSILTVDLTGLDKLTNGFGIMLLYQGASAIIGPPLAGLIMEKTESYNLTFFLTGCLILVSAVMCYPLNRIHRWEKARQARREAARALQEEIA